MGEPVAYLLVTFIDWSRAVLTAEQLMALPDELLEDVVETEFLSTEKGE